MYTFCIIIYVSTDYAKCMLNLILFLFRFIHPHDDRIHSFFAVLHDSEMTNMNPLQMQFVQHYNNNGFYLFLFFFLHRVKVKCKPDNNQFDLFIFRINPRYNLLFFDKWTHNKFCNSAKKSPHIRLWAPNFIFIIRIKSFSISEVLLMNFVTSSKDYSELTMNLWMQFSNMVFRSAFCQHISLMNGNDL